VKKLDRTLANKPACLTRFSHPQHDWDDLLTEDKTQIWAELVKFQQGFCAYCESPAAQGRGHIEHFCHKGKKVNGKAPHAHLTFDWSNLFGCCNSREHCGHFKDRTLPGGHDRVYDPYKLIKPNNDKPETFLRFTDSGRVQAKSDAVSARAIETINTLNLKAPVLVTARQNQMMLYKQRLNELDEQRIEMAMDDEAFDAEYAMIKDEAMKDAYRTAVRQVCF
jgi:uncharacterized protein (TIGR02646 family)